MSSQSKQEIIQQTPLVHYIIDYNINNSLEENIFRVIIVNYEYCKYIITIFICNISYLFSVILLIVRDSTWLLLPKGVTHRAPTHHAGQWEHVAPIAQGGHARSARTSYRAMRVRGSCWEGSHSERPHIMQGNESTWLLLPSGVTHRVHTLGAPKKIIDTFSFNSVTWVIQK